MPRQMAMERPNSRVILSVLQNHVRRCGRVLCVLKDVHVAAGGVGGVCDDAVPSTKAFGKDMEVVAVEMHGVGAGLAVVDDVEADGGVGAEIEDVPRGEKRVSLYIEVRWCGETTYMEREPREENMEAFLDGKRGKHTTQA